MNTHRPRGFTLIELATVLVLIGILSTIAVSRYRQYQAATQHSRAAQTLIAVRQSLAAAALQHKLPHQADAHRSFVEQALSAHNDLPYRFSAHTVPHGRTFALILQAQPLNGHPYGMWADENQLWHCPPATLSNPPSASKPSAECTSAPNPTAQ